MVPTITASPGELATELTDLNRVIYEAAEGAEELALALRKKRNADFGREEAWLLAGFTDEGILALRETIQKVLTVRGQVLGGLAEDEEDLWLAAGGRANEV